jgi:hypothetical protein
MLAAVNGKSRFRVCSPALRRHRWRGLSLFMVCLSVGVAALSLAQEESSENGKPSIAPKAVPVAGEVAEKTKAAVEDKESGKKAPAEPRVGLMVEAKLAGAKVYTSIPGAKATVLAAAQETQYGVRTFSDDEWREKAYDLKEFYSAAEATADGVVDALEPEFQRDSRDVIEYALVKSKDGFLSSALTSKRFLPRFEREFGGDLRVVVVDRYILYVFPAIGSKLETFGPALAEIYRTTPFPGSLEVFQVNEEGYRVVGTLDGK